MVIAECSLQHLFFPKDEVIPRLPKKKKNSRVRIPVAAECSLIRLGRIIKPPVDTVLIIFSFLPELAAVGIVCRQWRNAQRALHLRPERILYRGTHGWIPPPQPITAPRPTPAVPATCCLWGSDNEANADDDSIDN